METHQAKYESALDRLAAQIERRDKENTRWMIALAAVIIAVLGYIEIVF